MGEEDYGPIVEELKGCERDRSKILSQFRDWLKRLKNLKKENTRDPNNQSGDTTESVDDTITESESKRKLEVDVANKKPDGQSSPEPEINQQKK